MWQSCVGLALMVLCCFLPLTSNASDCPIQQLKAFAERLDSARLISIAQLAGEFDSLAAEKSPECVSNLFCEFRKYYYRILRTFSKSHLSVFDSTGNCPLDSLHSMLATFDMDIFGHEDVCYVWEKGTWVVKKFGMILPDYWKAYLAHRTDEIAHQFSNDARIIVPWDEIRKRIVFREEFLKQNPNFPERDYIQKDLDLYRRIYLTGLIFVRDIDAPELATELKQSYGKYMHDDSTSQYSSLVKRQYQILAKFSFVVSTAAMAELSAFNKSNGVDPVSWDSLPLR
jgi:hypothetical protein